MAARIDKRRLAFALLAGACLAAPVAFLLSSLPPDTPHASGLFAHMPVVDDPILNIHVRDGSLGRMRVYTSDSSQHMPVGDVDLGRIPVKQVARPSNPDADMIQVHQRAIGF